MLERDRRYVSHYLYPPSVRVVFGFIWWKYDFLRLDGQQKRAGGIATGTSVRLAFWTRCHRPATCSSQQQCARRNKHQVEVASLSDDGKATAAPPDEYDEGLQHATVWCSKYIPSTVAITRTSSIAATEQVYYTKRATQQVNHKKFATQQLRRIIVRTSALIRPLARSFRKWLLIWNSSLRFDAKRQRYVSATRHSRIKSNCLSVSCFLPGLKSELSSSHMFSIPVYRF